MHGHLTGRRGDDLGALSGVTRTLLLAIRFESLVERDFALPRIPVERQGQKDLLRNPRMYKPRCVGKPELPVVFKEFECRPSILAPGTVLWSSRSASVGKGGKNQKDAAEEADLPRPAER